MLSLEGIVAEREGRRILDGATLRVGDERVALVGANGSGKTTLLRVAAGLLPARAGDVRIDGAVVAPDRRARLVGWLPQRAPDAFFAATLAEEARRAGCDLAAHGLIHLAARHPLSLSEGERRRAAFALALARDPRVLLLDEPTAGLDAGAVAGVIAGIRGRPALVATHDPDLATACDRIVVLAEGRAHDAGAPSAFAAGPWPARLGWEALS